MSQGGWVQVPSGAVLLRGVEQLQWVVKKLFFGGYNPVLRKEKINMKYVCNVCGYVYDEEKGDPDNGIAPGTKWEDLPADFVCPLCGVGKDDFTKE